MAVTVSWVYLAAIGREVFRKHTRISYQCLEKEMKPTAGKLGRGLAEKDVVNLLYQFSNYFLQCLRISFY